MGFGKNNGEKDHTPLKLFYSDDNWIPSVLHANHFHKDWQRRVRTWFNQPGRKVRRRKARVTKAARLGVRPLKLLRPAVRAPTIRYNMKIREGRGFTLAELKEAGIPRKEARSIGICVDHRRRNLSEEGKSLNVARLKAYKERLIVFPRHPKKPKKGDSTGDDLQAETTRVTLPLPTTFKHEAPRKITEEEHEFQAYRTLRNARADARYAGAKTARKQKVRYIHNATDFRHSDYPLLFVYRRRKRKPPRRSNRISHITFLAVDMLLSSCICNPTCYFCMDDYNIHASIMFCTPPIR